nr:uncharacterized protein LOC124817683 isoform X2 [Hydra vulgaris]
MKDKSELLSSIESNSSTITSKIFPQSLQSPFENLAEVLKIDVKSEVVTYILWAIVGTILITGVIIVACCCCIKVKTNSKLIRTPIFTKLNRKLFNMKHCKTKKKINNINKVEKEINKNASLGSRECYGDIVRGSPHTFFEYATFKIFYTENSGFETFSKKI